MSKVKTLVMALAMITASVKADMVVHAPAESVRTMLIVQSTNQGWTLTEEYARWVVVSCWDHSPRGIPVWCQRAYLIMPLTASTTYVQSYAMFWRPDGYRYTQANMDSAAWRAQQIVANIETMLFGLTQQPEQAPLGPLTHL
jgi:hypothetical protein